MSYRFISGMIYHGLILLLMSSNAITQRYILYNVNPGEGFNLRRDVFLRIAIFVRKLNDAKYTLVLPPWGDLYHWQSEELGYQGGMPWYHFFDVESISRFVPVMELEDFLKLNITLSNIYYLQGYKEGWDGGKWEEKIDIQDCNDPPRYRKGNDGLFEGYFWGQGSTIKAKEFDCVSVQGSASMLGKLTESNKAILIDRAENVLHDRFGDGVYWACRRSMRFSKRLISIANEFRKDFLDSDDARDDTVLAEHWEDHKPVRSSHRGGPYLGVHLRRKDFVISRSRDIPSLTGAAEQLRTKMEQMNLKKLFVASDMPKEEFEEFKSYLVPGFEVHRFEPSSEVKEEIKDGGTAVVDQIICSHAKHFIGSFESTFSFRIQEEREIMGFKTRTTFDMMCQDGKAHCEKGSKWTIEYDNTFTHEEL